MNQIHISLSTVILFTRITMDVKYLEIEYTHYKRPYVENYFFPCDNTVTDKLVRKLKEYLYGTAIVYVKSFGMKREVIDHVNEISGNDKRFEIMEYVLTGEAIKKFIKCNEDVEQIGYDWIDGIDFETFQNSDPSDKSDSESDSEYESESE